MSLSSVKLTRDEAPPGASAPRHVEVRPGHIEPIALSAVCMRQWTVFKRFWRTRTFSAWSSR